MYRGIRQLLPPYEGKEKEFLLQYKCFILALFSKQYTFDDLYNGSLKKVKESEFERHIQEIDSLEELITYIQKCYRKEQQKVEKTMTTVPIKRFRLFKQLSIIMITLSIVLAVPLFYYMFVKDPYQDKLLTAHGEFLSSDYSGVISTLRREDPERLPYRTKYILSYSYIQVESLSNREKEAIMRNVSLRSDENYLLYWILNGRGNFEESIEKAMFIDDPQLIMYGLIKQLEQVRNDPQLSGSERDEEVRRLQDELNRYREDYMEVEDDGVTDGESLEEETVEGEDVEQEQDEEVDEEAEVDEDDEDEDEE